MKRIIREIPISPDYVRHWDVAEAGRELWANYLDSGRQIYARAEGSDWVIANEIDAALPASILVLGKTSKEVTDDTIGQFGEGLKLAIIVLLRAGLGVEIYNDNKRWTFSFEKSETWADSEILIMEETGCEEHEGVFEVRIIGGASYERELKYYCIESFLAQAPTDTRSFSTDGITIHFSAQHNGEVFVGGLFVENEGRTRYLIDIAANNVELNRERSSIVNDTLFKLYLKLFNAMDEAIQEDPEMDWLEGHMVEMIRGGNFANRIIDESQNSPFLTAVRAALKKRIDGKEVVFSDNEEAYANRMGVQVVRLQEFEHRLLQSVDEAPMRLLRKDRIGHPQEECEKFLKMLARVFDESGHSALKENEEILKGARRLRAMSPNWLSTIQW